MTPAQVAALSDEELGRALAERLGMPIVNSKLVTTGEGMLAVMKLLRGQRSVAWISIESEPSMGWCVGVGMVPSIPDDISVANQLAPRAVAEAALLALQEAKP